jgi:hypothetical protein
MTDQVTWGHNLLADDHQYLHDLDLFITEMRKQYGDKDRRQNSSTRAYHEIITTQMRTYAHTPIDFDETGGNPLEMRKTIRSCSMI